MNDTLKFYGLNDGDSMEIITLKITQKIESDVKFMMSYNQIFSDIIGYRYYPKVKELMSFLQCTKVFHYVNSSDTMFKWLHMVLNYADHGIEYDTSLEFIN